MRAELLSTILNAAQGQEMKGLACRSAERTEKRSTAYLDEADVCGVLAEALAADV